MRLDVNGIELHWDEHGEGEPLLWLHGGLGCGGDWRHVFGEPPAGFRLIAPDLRGHGRTTNPAGAFTFRQAAHDIRALLDHLRLPRVHAIGLSGGGIVLLHMATADPASIASMVLVSAPPYFPEEARRIQRAFSPDTVSAADLARMRAVHTGGEPQIQRLFETARGFADNYDDVNFTPPLLSTIASETLVVFGDRDPLYPVSLALELYRAIPRSYLWIVPNGGHGPVFRERAPRFAATSVEFLSGAWREG